MANVSLAVPDHPPADRDRDARRGQPPARVRRRLHHAVGGRRRPRRRGGAGLDGHRRRHRSGLCASGCSARDHRARRPRGHPGPGGRVRRGDGQGQGAHRRQPGLRLAAGRALPRAAQLLPAPGRVGDAWRTTPRASGARAAYEEWRAALHHFYDPFPVVEHFEAVVTR